MSNKFYTEFFDNKKSILIPVIQRDYVQGCRDDIILPFINSLLETAFEKNENCDYNEASVDLNYIYGYSKDNQFIPIDGQQRLITLWLFHLFLYIKNGSKSHNFPRLSFESREYANSFSNKLLESIYTIDTIDISKEENLDNLPWFISSWSKDITVKNMLSTWKAIYNSYNLQTDRTLKSIDKYNLNFKFCDLGSKDLKVDDSVYLKMNGRGKPLSYFDNLKAVIDEKITNYININNSKEKNVNSESNDIISNLKDWKFKIDNDWTDFVWKNRNRDQKYHEDISDEQIHLIFNFITLFWYEMGLDKFEENLNKNSKEEFLDKYIPLTVKQKGEKNSRAKAVLKKLNNVEVYMPLFLIDKLDLLPLDDTCNIFNFIFENLENLINIEKSLRCEIVGKNIYILDNDPVERKLNLFLDESNNKTSLLYRIALTNYSYKKLCYLYALVNTPSNFSDNSTFIQFWMRIIRNLVVNSTLNEDTITTFFKVVKTLRNYFETNNDVYLLNLTYNEQLNEEKYKLKLLIGLNNENENKCIYNTLFEAEQKYFLKGAIRFLFPIKEEKDVFNFDYDKYDLETFKRTIKPKYDKFNTYFNENGLKQDSTSNYKEMYITGFLRELSTTAVHKKEWKKIYDSKLIYTDSDILSLLLNKKYCHAIDSSLTKSIEDFVSAHKVEYKLGDLDLVNNVKDNYEYSFKRFTNLICDSSNLFIKTLLYKYNWFKGGRLKYNGGCSFHQAYMRTGIFLDRPKRDLLLFSLFNNFDDIVPTAPNDFIIKELTNGLEKDSDKIYPFFVGWDILFTLNNQKLFKWDSYNNIYLIIKDKASIVLKAHDLNSKYLNQLSLQSLDEICTKIYEILKNS